jgi:hypothetical protein
VGILGEVLGQPRERSKEMYNRAVLQSLEEVLNQISKEGKTHVVYCDRRCWTHVMEWRSGA